MDTLAHGLWTYAISRTQKKPAVPWWALILVGITPDLIWIIGQTLFHGSFSVLYHLSHSLIVWVVISSILYVWYRKAFALTWPWALHILIDIPGHLHDVATPFLWPVSSFAIRGWWDWLTGPWLVGNYAVLAIVFLLMRIRRAKHRP